MREIKFRGWDAKHKKMYYPVYFDNLEVWWWEPEKDEMEILGDRNPNGMLIHIELMQHTGIKDKNGGEAYAGDITQMSCLSGEKIVCVIAWNTARAQWRMEPTLITQKRGYIKMGWDLNRPFEIIGDIYNSPELLEGE